MLNEISSVGTNIGIGEAVKSLNAEKTIIDDFASYLGKSIAEVNNRLKEADNESQELAIGKKENIHEAMIALEKADITFRLLVQVRNKALEAYHQIMQMQV